MSSPQMPPTAWRDILRQLGPGLIIAAVIVGSGELIVTPSLGAKVGFTLLWFIILGCLLKVFVQVELGRYAISHGKSTLEALNTLPGPRMVVSWILWLWLLMYLALVAQVAGMVGGIAEVFQLAGLNLPIWMLGLGTVGLCSLLLITGRYRLVELTSTIMVALFTLCTIVAVVALQWSPYAISLQDITGGLSFHLPENAGIAFAAFGVIGVGASELIYYPYWCLEKGYARYVGSNDGSPQWVARARGWIRVMRIDAWVSLVIYTGATIAFYLLCAAILHGKGMNVDNSDMIKTLSHMYVESFGPWSLSLFLVGAGVVLFSTVFGATASNARLAADALSLFKLVKYKDTEQRARVVKVACIILPFASLLVYLMSGNPVKLVFIGAIAQGVMLPFLGLAALYFRFTKTERKLRPGTIWTSFLILAAASMVVLGTYQVYDKLKAKPKVEAVPAPAPTNANVNVTP